jgi:hypothetical protein
MTGDRAAPRRYGPLAGDTPSASAVQPTLLERVLLARPCDLDVLLEDQEIAQFVRGFAPSYVLVALPKSSSTYCTEVLAKILDAAVHKDIVTQDRRTPKDLSVAGIVNGRDRLTLSQVHLTATGANLRLLRVFHIEIAILLRNLFDVVVSLRDHMDDSPYFSSILMPNAYAALGDADKLDYIIDTAVPWAITFYASWAQAIARGDADGGFVHYEDMVREPVRFFRGLSAQLCRGISDATIEQCLAKVGKSEAMRFNVGRAGRGQEELSAAQIGRIRRHADYYPGIDFAPLGL